MLLDNLLNLIRKEDVIIWAGAGFSMYAGYPSGNRLCNILLNSLSDSERKNINENLQLPGLAEEFYRIKGGNKNSLLQTLKKVILDFQPKSTEYHDKLSRIPHFKTIITTNYDPLFENAYGLQGELIFSDEHIPYLDKNKVEIFKVHGDLSKPNSVIITNSDYNNYFRNRAEYDIFWTVVKERLSTKNILFIGYGLEDPNVSVIFDRITEKLGTNRKECFLVAPSLPQHKVTDLVMKKVHYIDLTGEELIDRIIENVKENILTDFENGDVSEGTLRKFLSHFDLKTNLTTIENSYKIDQISSIKGEINGHLNLEFKKDESFITAFNKFMSGENFGNFEIDSNILLSADIRLEGIRLNDPKETSKIELRSIPKISSNINIEFNNGFELYDIPMKVFSSKKMIEAHFQFKSGEIVIKFPHPTGTKIDFKFNFEHTENFVNTKFEIDMYTLLLHIGNGEKLTIYFNEKDSYSNAFPVDKNLVEKARVFLDHFTNLKQIERHYNIRFKDFNFISINSDDIDIAKKLVSLIKGGKLEQDWNGNLVFTLKNNSPKVLNELKMIHNSTSPLEIDNQANEIIDLHGKKISLGHCKIEINNCKIENMEAIARGETLEAIVISKTKKALISYSKSKSGNKNQISIKP